MPYRQTENVVRKLAARHDAILAAARDVAAEGGMAAVQIAPVAERAGIAAGHGLSLFPRQDRARRRTGRGASGARESAALGDAPPLRRRARFRRWRPRSPRSRRARWRGARLAFALHRRAGRARGRRRAGAIPAGARRRIRAAHRRGACGRTSARPGRGARGRRAGRRADRGPDRPARAAEPQDDPAKPRAQVQALTLLALRALGVVDARARGLVVQTVLPVADRRAVRSGRGSLQRRGRDPVGHRAQRVFAAPVLLVRLEHRKLGVGRRAGADDGAAAADLGRAAERLGVGGDVLDHAVEHLGDRDRARLGDEGAVHAVALRPPFVLDHDRALHRVEIGIALAD